MLVPASAPVLAFLALVPGTLDRGDCGCLNFTMRCERPFQLSDALGNAGQSIATTAGRLEVVIPAQAGIALASAVLSLDDWRESRKAKEPKSQRAKEPKSRRAEEPKGDSRLRGNDGKGKGGWQWRQRGDLASAA